jgi:hypothetical protein
MTQIRQIYTDLIREYQYHPCYPCPIILLFINYFLNLYKCFISDNNISRIDFDKYFFIEQIEVNFEILLSIKL